MQARSTRQIVSGWKDIAAYLRCSVRAAQDWERREGLKIYRYPNRVWAYMDDLDEFLRQRTVSPLVNPTRSQLEEKAAGPNLDRPPDAGLEEPPSDVAVASHPSASPPHQVNRLSSWKKSTAFALVAAIVLFCIGILTWLWVK